MKTKEVKDKKKDTAIINFTINHELNDKYDDEPLFEEKVVKANEILKKAGVPKF